MTFSQLVTLLFLFFIALVCVGTATFVYCDWHAFTNPSLGWPSYIPYPWACVVFWVTCCSCVIVLGGIIAYLGCTFSE